MINYKVIDDPSKKQFLSSDETRQYLIPACISAAVHRASEIAAAVWLLPFDHFIVQPRYITKVALVGTLQARNTCYYDPRTYLKVMVVQNQKNEIWITFGTVGSSLSEEMESLDEQTNYQKIAQRINQAQNLQAVGNLFGQNIANYKEASRLVAHLLESPYFQNKRVFLVGQCYGGSIAQYVGIDLKIPTLCFNCLPLGISQKKSLGAEKLEAARQYITHISIEGDYVSDTWIPQASSFFSNLLIPSPENLGPHLYIPSAYKGKNDTHTFVIGSVMKHLGYTSRTTPPEIPDEERFKIKNIIIRI